MLYEVITMKQARSDAPAPVFRQQIKRHDFAPARKGLVPGRAVGGRADDVADRRIELHALVRVDGIHAARRRIVRVADVVLEQSEKDEGDWFKADPCTNLQTDPNWYAPDLIKLIRDSKVKHEIGSHTFSHSYNFV